MGKNFDDDFKSIINLKHYRNKIFHGHNNWKKFKQNWPRSIYEIMMENGPSPKMFPRWDKIRWISEKSINKIKKKIFSNLLKR
jgi:hypothetical protein